MQQPSLQVFMRSTNIIEQLFRTSPSIVRKIFINHQTIRTVDKERKGEKKRSEPGEQMARTRDEVAADLWIPTKS